MAVVAMAIPIVMASSDAVRLDSRSSHVAMIFFVVAFMVLMVLFSAQTNNLRAVVKKHRPGGFADLEVGKTYRVLEANNIDGAGWLILLVNAEEPAVPGNCGAYLILETYFQEKEVRSGDVLMLDAKDGFRTIKHLL